MADLVENIIENMIPDLMSFIKRRIFTKKEIKQILKARKNIEYTFLRRTCDKKDFLKAIEYEYDLEKKRREKFKELKLKKQTTKDYSIIKRIIFIFDRMMSKYPYDIDLIKEYLSFCYKIKSNKMFNKAVSVALQFNPNTLDIWLLAVYFQFEVNNNPFKARKIFLKAIKLNQNDHAFWLEYFKFELKFIQKIKQRRAILASDNAVNKPNNDDSDMEIEDKLSETAKKEKDSSETIDIIKFDGEETSMSMNSVNPNDEALEQLPYIIFETSLDKFSADNMIKYLTICNEYEDEWLKKLKGKLYKVLMQKYNNQTNIILNIIFEYYGDIKDKQVMLGNILAEIHQHVKTDNNDDNASLIYEYLIEKLVQYTTKRIIDQSIVLDTLDKLIGSLNQDLKKKLENSPNVVKGLCKLTNKSKETTSIIHTTLLNSFNIFKDKDTKITIKIIKAIINSNPSQPQQKQVLLDNKTIPEFSFSYISTHLINLNPKQRYQLLTWSLDEGFNTKTDQELINHMKFAIKILSTSEYFENYSLKFLEILLSKKPFESKVVQDIVKLLLDLKGICPVQVIQRLINEIKNNQKANLVKRFYSMALTIHPQSKELWLGFIQWEKDHGNPLECQEIFYRAQKHIKDDQLIKDYMDLMSV